MSLKSTFRSVVVTFIGLFASIRFASAGVPYQEATCKILSGAPQAWLSSTDEKIGLERCFALMHRVLLREGVRLNGEIDGNTRGRLQYTDELGERVCDFFMLKRGRTSDSLVEYIYLSDRRSDPTIVPPGFEQELRETIGLSCEFLGM